MAQLLLLCLVLISSRLVLAYEWNQPFSDAFYSSRVNFSVSHSDWSSLTLPSSLSQLAMDSNSMIFDANRKSFYVILGQSKLVEVNALNGNAVLRAELPYSSINTVQSSPLLTSDGQLIIARAATSTDVIAKIETQNEFKSSFVSLDSPLVSMVYSKSANMLIIFCSKKFMGIDASTLQTRWLTPISSTLYTKPQTIGNMFLIPNENNDNRDVAYASYSTSIFRIDAASGIILNLQVLTGLYNGNYLMNTIGYLGVPGYVVSLIQDIQQTNYSLMSSDLLKQDVGKITPLSNFNNCQPPMGQLTWAIADRYFFGVAILCSSERNIEGKIVGSHELLSYSISAARVGQQPKLPPPSLQYSVQKDESGLQCVLGPMVSVSDDHSQVVIYDVSGEYQVVDWENKAIVKKWNVNSGIRPGQQTVISATNGKMYVCHDGMNWPGGVFNCQSLSVN